MWDTASFQQIPPKLHSVKKQVNSQWEFAIWLKEFKLGLYNNLVGWEWAWGGREIQEVGDICTPIVNSCWCMTNQNIFWWLCIVNKAEIDIFLELCFFHDPMMLAIWSLVPLPFLNPGWTSGSSWFTYCWTMNLATIFAKLCLTLATPWTVACQAPLSMGFSRQEYWSGLLFPTSRDLPNPAVEPRSPLLQAES